MQIKLKDAQPGMISLKDILMPDGKVLLKAHQIITNETISTCVKYGIETIEADPPSPRLQITPKITVKLEREAFSARLIIEPTGQDDETVTYEILKQHLENAGVVCGIDEKALRLTADKFCENKRRYEIDYAALGTPSEPGKEGPLRMTVKFISGSSDFDAIKRAQYYWQIADIGQAYQKVTSGTVIGEKQIERPSVPGMNVKGEPVFTDDVIRSKIKLDHGVSLTKDGNQVLATITGYAYNFDGLIGVIALNFDGTVDISPSIDKMSALLTVHAPGEGGKMPSEKEIRALFASTKVSFGVHEDIFKNLLFDFTQGHFPKEPVLIAEGIAPKNGENGRLEFLFPTETSLKPKENPDGSVDFKNVDIITAVSQGQHLVKAHPPGKGIPGRNICGDTVVSKDGAPVVLPMGQNTEILSTDRSLLVASIAGIARYTGTLVEVNEGFVVNGDVDFSTGHVNYEKTVIIKGDVKTGFNINCGGDLQIGGTIEDSIINVGGNVLCKYGFVGQGKGIIDAKGDINLGFMKNQIVKSRGNISIAKEALNSTIYARKLIRIHGNQLSVAGGYLVARDGIIVHTVGNHSGIRTTLEVGVDYTLVEELEKSDKLLKELTINYTKLVESYSKYEKLAAMKGKLSPQEQTLVNKMVDSISKFKQQMHALDERKKLIQKKMYHIDQAYIKIERSALPGTLLKFGERHHLIKDELVGPKLVKMIEQEIRIL